MDFKEKSWILQCGLSTICLVAGCQTTTPTASISTDANASPDVRAEMQFPQTNTVDLKHEEGPSIGASDSTASSLVEYGTGQYVSPLTKRLEENNSVEAGDGASFQFRNAPLDAVLSQILGEAFNTSYIIAPNVSGNITLRLDGVTDVNSAIDALNAALDQQGIRISPTAKGYLISRQTGEGRRGDGRFDVIVDGSQTPVGETAILLLKYANPDEVVELARPILPGDVVESTDVSRGLILLQGTSSEVAAAVDVLRSFDVDWFAATSNAFVQLETAQAEEIKSELDQILGRTGGVEVVALPRLRAVMVFARSRELLDRSQAMIAQLDRRADQLVDAQTLIYEARYVSAERLKNAAESLVAAGHHDPLATEENKRHRDCAHRFAINSRPDNMTMPIAMIAFFMEDDDTRLS